MSPREIAEQVSWAILLEEVGVDPGRRGRTYCAIHKGHNGTTFLYNEGARYAHCFNCNWNGDKLAFLQAVLAIDFKTALVHLARIGGVQLGDYRRPTKQEQRHLQASRTALAATRDAYEQWCHKRWRLLCQWNEKLLAEKSDADLVLHLAQKDQGSLPAEEITKWEKQKQIAESGLECLAWELDIFHYRQYAALRFKMWEWEVGGGI